MYFKMYPHVCERLEKQQNIENRYNLCGIVHPIGTDGPSTVCCPLHVPLLLISTEQGRVGGGPPGRFACHAVKTQVL